MGPQAQCPRRSPYFHVKGPFSLGESNLILVREDSRVCLALRVLDIGAHWVFGHKRICVTAKVFLVPECVPSCLCWLHLGHRRLAAQPAVIFASTSHVSFRVLLPQKTTTPAAPEPQIHYLRSRGQKSHMSGTDSNRVSLWEAVQKNPWACCCHVWRPPALTDSEPCPAPSKTAANQHLHPPW